MNSQALTPELNLGEVNSLSYPAGLPDDVAPRGDFVNAISRTGLLLLGLSGAVLVVGALGVETRKQFFFSYLFGYIFALDIALGALFWVLIHHVSDAGWSVGLRRIYENLSCALVPLTILFLPILTGIFTGNLHDWYAFVIGPEPMSGTPEQHQWHIKHIYFSTPFFVTRLFIYFGIWLSYSTAMRKWSLEQDREGGITLSRKMQWWAPSGLLLLGLTTTFFTFDVLMSLQYTWFSTIYGVYFWAGAIRSSLSSVVLLAITLRYAGLLRSTLTIEHLHDTGKLMFGFTIFWAYIGFSQYFLIWYGNMQEETQFYLLRRNGNWYTASILLPLIYFIVPFFLLLPRAFKRNSTTLAIAAGWILLGHAFDLYWQILPVLHRDRIHFHWLDASAIIFTSCVVLLTVIGGFRNHPLIPIRDIRLNETIGYENDSA